MRKENSSLMSISRKEIEQNRTLHFSFTLTLSLSLSSSQNWIAYESLQNAAKLKTDQQIVDFPNDESPKEEYHNAFCQVRDRSLYIY